MPDVSAIRCRLLPKLCGKQHAGNLNTAKDHVKCCGELGTECSRCHAAVKRANGNSHNDECLMADIQCECGVLLKRADADEHRRNMCALQEIVCPLKCGETVKRFVLFLYSALQDLCMTSQTSLSKGTLERFSDFYTTTLAAL